MKLEKFVEKYVTRRIGDGTLYPGWVEEVQRMARNEEMVDSAGGRGVSTNAVKNQRKRIFKALKTENARTLVTDMLAAAVAELKEK